MSNFKKFPSIEQFRQVIKQVTSTAQYHGNPIPTIRFTGTVKLHGTNAGVGVNIKDGGTVHYQSRERLLGLRDDNAGFMMWGSASEALRDLIERIRTEFNPVEDIYIYGEWAGAGIQKGVAISHMPKSFFVFRIEVDGKEVELDETLFDKASNIYSMSSFQTWEIDIDFSRPDLVQNKLVEWTLQVEEQCPVGAHFGFAGIGEGIVWHNSALGLTFKTKGEKHSASKVKTVKEIAAVDIELMNSMTEFIETACTENRMNQGLEKLREAGKDSTDNKNIGDFIKWLANDIFREEADTIVANQFETKKLGGLIATKARTFYMNQPIVA